MFESYETIIEKYCKKMGISVPIGFERRSACRFGAIDQNQMPPKLVAITWSNESDVVDYLLTLKDDNAMKLLDFKDRRELTFNGKKSLLRGDSF